MESPRWSVLLTPHPLPTFFQHPPFKSTTLTPLLTCINPFWASLCSPVFRSWPWPPDCKGRRAEPSPTSPAVVPLQLIWVELRCEQGTDAAFCSLCSGCPLLTVAPSCLRPDVSSWERSFGRTPPSSPLSLCPLSSTPRTQAQGYFSVTRLWPLSPRTGTGCVSLSSQRRAYCLALSSHRADPPSVFLEWANERQVDQGLRFWLISFTARHLSVSPW